MTHRFAELMFTPAVKAMQERMGSRGTYERFEDAGAPARDQLGEVERAFIAARDSFYMATVSETGWPYVQHRGGPLGFLKVLDDRTLGFADYKGNRQYVSVGNLATDNRVSLFLVDYPNRRRLKLLGYARIVGARTEPDLLARLRDEAYDARVERGMTVTLEGFDWNCPQHITPRFTESEVAQAVAPLVKRLQAAESGLAHSGVALGLSTMGSGPLELVVSGVRQLTPRVRGYELRAPDGSDLPAFVPGAHLAMPVRIKGEEHVRRYSISSDPSRRDAYEIAVLGVGDGSAAVQRDYQLGARLRCEPPRNAFALHDDPRPAVLIAGGIGITPIRSMASRLLKENRAFELHFAARSHAEAAYLPELSGLLGERLHFHDGADRFDVGALLDAAPRDAVVYVCGPARLIEAVQKAAAMRGWAADRVKAELFSAGALATGRAFDLVLARSGKRVHVPVQATALEALEEAGIEVPSSCRTGVCGTCVVSVRNGSPEHRDRVLTAAEHQSGAFATCVSRAASPELELDL